MPEPQTVKISLFRPIAALIGPAAVMTAGIMGAGSTVSLLTAGCYFQYGLLWAIFLSLPVIVVCQDTASRIGLASGEKGMMRVVADQTHPIVMIVILIPLLFTCISANIGQLGAMVSSTQTLVNFLAKSELLSSDMNPAGKTAFYLALAFVCLVINATGGYKRTEKILSYLLFLVLVCFLIVAAKAFFHLSEITEIIRGLYPSLPDDAATPAGGSRDSFVSFAAIFGGGVAATAILSFPYFTAEGGYEMQEAKEHFWKHFWLLGVLFGFYSCILMIAGGYALYPLEGSAGFEGAEQVGLALNQVVGAAGPVFFSIGLMICAYTTLTVVAQLGTYFLLDCLGKNWRFEKGNSLFTLIYSSLIVLPALIAPVWQFPELLKVVISMVINSVVSPFAIILIFVLINKKAFAGRLAASPLRNLFLLYSIGVSLFTCIRTVMGFVEYLRGIFGS